MIENKVQTPSLDIKLFNGTNLRLPTSLTKLEEATTELLKDAYQENVPNFWEYEKAEHIYIPVDDGEIRVIHIKPENPISKRPLLFLPGWAVPPIAFQDLYEIMHNKYDFYYLETREKSSSKIRRLGNFSMSQKAKDIGVAIKYLKLDKIDFILAGTCWGSAMIIQGLMDKTVVAPTIVLLDPMHYFAFSRVITFFAPIIPVVVLKLLKPILRRQRIGEMKEKRQLERVDAVIDDITYWKWKRAAHQCRNFEMYGNLHKIDQEVFIVNVTEDYIHKAIDYPNIAHQIPKGRFLQLHTTEDRREYAFGAVIGEYAKVTKEEYPDLIGTFEVKFPRDH
jgi:hypothetical protein